MAALLDNEAVESYTADYGAPVTVPVVAKSTRWKDLQEMGYNGVIGHLKNDFHGLQDVYKQLTTYSMTNPSVLLKPLKAIAGQMLLNKGVEALTMFTPLLGTVGKLFGSIPGFGQVFAMDMDLLKDPQSLENKVQSVASNLGSIVGSQE